MNFDVLLDKLRKSGITLSPTTIRRWAKGGDVTPPKTRHRRKGEGRGKISDWSQQSLEEIAGIWALRHYGFRESSLFFREFEDSIQVAKFLADQFYRDPISWELRLKQGIYDKHYVRKEFDDLFKAAGKQLCEADYRNLTEWIVAIEKIRRGYQISQSVYCDFVFLYDGNLNDRTLRYQFFAVRLLPIEETKQSQIRVLVYKRDVFVKAVRDTYGGKQNAETE